MCVCICIIIIILIIIIIIFVWISGKSPVDLGLTASRQGQDKRGRHGSAAIPPNQLPRENVGDVWQHISNAGNTLQRVATCAHWKQHMSKCREFVTRLRNTRLSRPRLEASERKDRHPVWTQTQSQRALRLRLSRYSNSRHPLWTQTQTQRMHIYLYKYICLHLYLIIRLLSDSGWSHSDSDPDPGALGLRRSRFSDSGWSPQQKSVGYYYYYCH